MAFEEGTSKLAWGRRGVEGMGEEQDGDQAGEVCMMSQEGNGSSGNSTADILPPFWSQSAFLGPCGCPPAKLLV